MPTPRALSGRNASNRRCTSSAGKEAEGSSRTSTFDSTASARAMGTSDFFGDRHPIDQTKILMDESDRLTLPKLGRPVPVGRTPIINSAFVRVVNAGKRLDQR